MMKLICLLGWRYMLNFYPWSQEPHAFCWLRYEQAILHYNSLKCWFVFKYLMCFTFLDILGRGHRIWGPPSDLGDAHSGLAVAPWPFYHSTLHLFCVVFCESDFSRRGMFHITRSSFDNRTWMLCVVCVCGWVQWLPESARYDVLTGNQGKALATLKRIAAENGAPMPLGKLTAARQVRDLHTVSLSNLYMPVWSRELFPSLGGSWEDWGPVFIPLPLDYSPAVVYLVCKVIRPRSSCSCDGHRRQICTFSLCDTAFLLFL